MDNKKVALITGANKGIGFEICKGLLKIDKSLVILLGARDAELGQASVNALLKEFPESQIELCIVDLNKVATIEKAAAEVQAKYGGLDILVNNAAMAWKGSAFNEEVARTTIAVNYFGTKDVCTHFMPLVRPHGRVVHVSSFAGSIAKYGTKVKDALLSPTLTVEQLDALMTQFIENVRDGTHAENGWPNSTYGVSKAALNALTRIQHRSPKKEGVMIYACCPGWCATDMSSNQGNKTAAQGSETPVWCALQPQQSPVKEGFYSEKTLRDW